jgi:Protein of unknown function (DUF2934)
MIACVLQTASQRSVPGHIFRNKTEDMGKMTTTTTKKTAANGAEKPAAAANGEPAQTPLPAPEKKPAPKAKRVRRPAAPKTGKPATARRTTKATKTSTKSRSASTKPAYTNEDVALRAYFIAEKRRQLGLYGSPESDWLEAERQLREGLTA